MIPKVPILIIAVVNFPIFLYYIYTIGNLTNIFNQQRNFSEIGYIISIPNQFSKIMLVLTRCNIMGTAKDSQMTKVFNLSTKYGFHIDFADCNPQMNNVEGRETGIMLRWIIRNYHNISTYQYNKILFHHAHENSWHQHDLTNNLARLFKTRYFWENEFGEIYYHYIDHAIKIINGTSHIFYLKFDLLQALSDLTNGTSWQYYNRTNLLYRWRSGQSSSFFVSSKLILKHPLSDYKLLLDNVRKVVHKYNNYYIGEVTERSWQVLFTNCSWPCGPIPYPNNSRMILYRF